VTFDGTGHAHFRHGVLGVTVMAVVGNWGVFSNYKWDNP
jgi:hypothetical protein